MAGVQGVQSLSGATNATAQPEYYSEGWVDPYAEFASPADSLGVDQYTWETPPPMPWLYGQDANGWMAPPPPAIDLGTIPATMGPGTDTELSTAPIETGSHNAPWPSFGVDDSIPYLTEYNQEQLQASEAIHGSDTGQADIVTQAGRQPNAPWTRTDIDYETRGDTMLSTDVPDQIKGNLAGSRAGQHGDHTQGYEWDQQQVPEDQEGFVRMPSASSDVAGNFMWLDPALRPVEVRPTGYRDWPVGEYSPFAGQVPGSSGGAGWSDGAVVDTAPPEYTPPGEPDIGPALNDQGVTSWSVW